MDKLISCEPGTTAAKIRKWGFTLKHGFVSKYNETKISSIRQLEEMINKYRSNGETSAIIRISTIT